jgi:hypothetical protein
MLSMLHAPVFEGVSAMIATLPTGVVCVWWQRVSSPAQQQSPCPAANPVGAVRQPTASAAAQTEQHESLNLAEGLISTPTQQQFARLAAEAPAARAAAAELQRQPAPLKGAVGPAMPQSRAGKRKHGCASCCWCAAGCEQCRADYGRGLAVSSIPDCFFTVFCRLLQPLKHARSCCLSLHK